ncbi:oxidoreductase NAD-binding domain-containing protein 1 [Cladorrhinum sp. PSN332]|nr:oxidoreductase NAD-binding domain-containing protein 1 [Cladorrhinum sp. PSN332]
MWGELSCSMHPSLSTTTHARTPLHHFGLGSQCNSLSLSSVNYSAFTMTTKESHIDRTSHEPRDASLHTLLITSINQISPTVRVFTLTSQSQSPPPIQFNPGQWLDLYHPPFSPSHKPGGFTITSSPFPPSSSLELAIQSPPPPSPSTNPSLPTQYLWTSPSALLLNTEVKIRVGGSFTFPPTGVPMDKLKRVVFVAGGMGINPLMSMLSYISTQQELKEKVEVRVLYSVKEPEEGLEKKMGEVLFLERIVRLFKQDEGGLRGSVKLSTTGRGKGGDGEINLDRVNIPVARRRIRLDDVEEAIGGGKAETAVYICGPPKMTDDFVEGLTSPDRIGMDEDRVLYEKWW